MLQAILLCGQCDAASITAVRSTCFYFNKGCAEPPDTILIDGLIKKGDAEKFFDRVYEIKSKRRLFGVILRSPGGSVDEAMMIGRLVRKLLIETQAPIYLRNSAQPYCPETDLFPARAGSCVCASACFLVWAAGAPREISYLLLHRAYIEPSKNAELDLDTSLKVANQVRGEVSSYLREMEIPAQYATIMFSTPSNSAVNIDYKSMRDRIAGYPAAIDEWLMAKCKILSFGQDLAWHDAVADSGDQEAMHKFEQQESARDVCVWTALDDKRFRAFDEWQQEYLQIRSEAGQSPTSPPAAAAPKLPDDFGSWVTPDGQAPLSRSPSLR